MVVKYYYFLLVVMLMISSITSENLGFNFPWSKKADTKKFATTLPPETVHLTMHEKSYSTEEKVKYINDCVKKCMATQPQRLEKRDFLDLGRDNCIEIHCQIYERRR
ncbi:unnamed protein product [Rotaria socialis]|uniref:Uncharacterized protein n=2 Tax=Rotaria socialis TaxID=392032 RepID=A0A818YRX9_9BILA|nr:unnamed protein product [Rotaria socialis]CAF3663367.1 unnamed protein product [Rotaria socialis]CAF3758551.1 unnamed protein product [Rotaria socialis]CAF4410134.1 unnamed protein product [Rotaria socialis]CAF4432341.1 unnamed protein product [Rotaria socialis]